MSGHDLADTRLGEGISARFRRRVRLLTVIGTYRRTAPWPARARPAGAATRPQPVELKRADIPARHPVPATTGLRCRRRRVRGRRPSPIARPRAEANRQRRLPVEPTRTGRGPFLCIWQPWRTTACAHPATDKPSPVAPRGARRPADLADGTPAPVPADATDGAFKPSAEESSRLFDSWRERPWWTASGQLGLNPSPAS